MGIAASDDANSCGHILQLYSCQMYWPSGENLQSYPGDGQDLGTEEEIVV